MAFDQAQKRPPAKPLLHLQFRRSAELFRESLRDWTLKRSLRLHELAALKVDIDKGLADLATGRLTEFNADKIIERGRKLLASRSLTV